MLPLIQSFIISFYHSVLYCPAEGIAMPTKAELVRELRLDKRLTQQEVAEKMKISQASYSGIERGEKPRAVEEAFETINRMRTRTDRTDGGTEKAGKLK